MPSDSSLTLGDVNPTVDDVPDGLSSKAAFDAAFAAIKAQFGVDLLAETRLQRLCRERMEGVYAEDPPPLTTDLDSGSSPEMKEAWLRRGRAWGQRLDKRERETRSEIQQELQRARFAKANARRVSATSSRCSSRRRARTPRRRLPSASRRRRARSPSARDGEPEPDRVAARGAVDRRRV